MSEPGDTTETPTGDPARREAVLESALRTFARYGYRKTSMDDLAREAQISRPGLYFLFSSKSGLFRAAADRGIDHDLRRVRDALESGEGAPGERVVDAFDAWAGRYVGPLQDVTAVLDENPELLGPSARSGPERFAGLLRAALERAGVDQPAAVAQTLISASIGIKHQVATREEYLARITTAVALVT